MQRVRTHSRRRLHNRSKAVSMESTIKLQFLGSGALARSARANSKLAASKPAGDCLANRRVLQRALGTFRDLLGALEAPFSLRRISLACPSQSIRYIPTQRYLIRGRRDRVGHAAEHIRRHETRKRSVGSRGRSLRTRFGCHCSTIVMVVVGIGSA